jgi:hypothetical protein
LSTPNKITNIFQQPYRIHQSSPPPEATPAIYSSQALYNRSLLQHNSSQALTQRPPCSCHPLSPLYKGHFLINLQSSPQTQAIPTVYSSQALTQRPLLQSPPAKPFEIRHPLHQNSSQALHRGHFLSPTLSLPIRAVCNCTGYIRLAYCLLCECWYLPRATLPLGEQIPLAITAHLLVYKITLT